MSIAFFKTLFGSNANPARQITAQTLHYPGSGPNVSTLIGVRPVKFLGHFGEQWQTVAVVPVVPFGLVWRKPWARIPGYLLALIAVCFSVGLQATLIVRPERGRVLASGAMSRMVLATLLLLSLSCATGPGIPDWYKRDIGPHLRDAVAVILYRTESVKLESVFGPYCSYRVDTTTLSVLKGTAPVGACYMMHSEGKRDYSNETGKERLVILMRESDSKCGEIEPGLSAPGSDDYVSLFRSVIAEGD